MGSTLLFPDVYSCWNSFFQRSALEYSSLLYCEILIFPECFFMMLYTSVEQAGMYRGSPLCPPWEQLRLSIYCDIPAGVLKNFLRTKYLSESLSFRRIWVMVFCKWRLCLLHLCLLSPSYGKCGSCLNQFEPVAPVAWSVLLVLEESSSSLNNNLLQSACPCSSWAPPKARVPCFLFVLCFCL